VVGALIAVQVVTALSVTAAPARAPGLALQGAAAEAFLRTARVVSMENIPVGVTRPRRLTLSDGTRSLRAAWKTIDEYRPLERLAKGPPQIGFRDSYKHEIAAYELDKLRGLGRVPPTVERTIRGERGALELWVEGCITEGERRRRGLHAPDTEAWNETMYTIRLLHQLVDDSDFNNVSNILVSSDFRIYVIDFSRAFGIHTRLRSPKALTRFSRSLLDRLRALNQDLVRDHLGAWLTRRQIASLLKRRDRILELARSRVSVSGEAAVLFD